MQRTESNQRSVISTLKEWAAPSLVAIVGMLVWRDITELRSDVKLLLYEQSANNVKIEMLETDVKDLKIQMAYIIESKSSEPVIPANETSEVRKYAIKEENIIKPILTNKK